MTKENNENFDAANPDPSLLEIRLSGISTALYYDRDNQELISKDGLAYPVGGYSCNAGKRSRKISKDKA